MLFQENHHNFYMRILDNGERGKNVGKRIKNGKNYEYQLDE